MDGKGKREAQREAKEGIFSTWISRLKSFFKVILSMPMVSIELTKKNKKNKMLEKLEESELDVPREQGLSRVESKGRKVDSKRRDKTPPSMQVTKEQSISVGNLDSGSRLRDYGDSKTRRRSNLKSFITSSQNRSILDLSDSRKKIGESSISGSSSHSRSESVSEEEAYYGGCLEDWHAFADAINANEKQQNMFSASPPKPHIGIDCIGSEQPKKKGVRKKRVNTGSDMNSHLCPLCCEDLDATDLSFLPCSCGYQLCLFCHKLILEQDGRCPNCRKQYDPVY